MEGLCAELLELESLSLLHKHEKEPMSVYDMQIHIHMYMYVMLDFLLTAWATEHLARGICMYNVHVHCMYILCAYTNCTYQVCVATCMSFSIVFSLAHVQYAQHHHPCELAVGPALSGANLGGGREGDLQDLSGVLEQSGRWPVQRKSILQFSLSHAAESAELSSPQATLPHCAFQGTHTLYILRTGWLSC